MLQIIMFTKKKKQIEVKLNAMHEKYRHINIQNTEESKQVLQGL